MRPCDLLPGISILASRPAARPRTIHAMIPITDSLARDQVAYAGVSHAGEMAMGVGHSRVLTVPWPVASCRHRSVHEKSPSQGIQRDSCAIAGAWVRSLPLYYIPPAYPRPWACGVLPAPFRARKKSEPRHTTRFLRDCRCLGPELAFILHSPG